MARHELLRGSVILLNAEVEKGQVIAGLAFFYPGVSATAQTGALTVKVPTIYQNQPNGAAALNLTLELHHVPTLEEPAPTTN
jgi:hypothetical protein